MKIKNNINSTTKSHNTFGMKFKFERLSPNGDWFSADREFFNSTYQLGIISSMVKKLSPKEDEFILKLDLPKTDLYFDKENIKCKLISSYDMFVDIVGKNTKTTHDLSEKNIHSDYFDAKDRLEVHKKGPFNKLFDLIMQLEDASK